ncbi:MAG: hypothetical protein WCQ99_14770 [Pseudomonadota bacterium]
MNRINAILENRLYSLIIVTAFFTLFGLWKFSDVLFIPGMCLTNAGDGLGALTMYHSFSEDIQSGNYSVLFGDRYTYKNICFGIAMNGGMNIFWKLHMFLLGSLCSPETQYDLTCLISFILIGIGGFLLARTLGVSFLCALFAAILVSHLDNFRVRISGHIHLAAYYMPFFLLVAAVKAGKLPSLKNLIISSLLAALNFNLNEYYGYFGLFFALFIFTGYAVIYSSKHSINIRTGVKNLIIAASVFVVALFLLYPNTIALKAWDMLFHTTYSSISLDSARPWTDFIHYATGNPYYLFKPGMPFLLDLFPSKYFNNHLWEFSFRIGTVIPVCICSLFLCFTLKALLIRSNPESFVMKESLVWICGSLFIALFGLSPDRYIISLVPFTHKIAPMFRVGVRAFLFVDIALVISFTLLLSHTISFIATAFIAKKAKRAAGYFVIAWLMFAACADVSNSSLLQKIIAYPLPDTIVYSVLKNKPEGLLLEVPFHSPYDYPPEATYIYFYNYVAHNKPIVNTPWGLEDKKLLESLHQFSLKANSPNDQNLDELKRSGIRYIAAHSKNYIFKASCLDQDIMKKIDLFGDKTFDFSYLDRSNAFKKIAADGSITIYEAVIDDTFNTVPFLKNFNLKPSN